MSAFTRSPALAREEAYFRTNIGSIKTAEALVADRRLLSVALDAYGLGGDLNNRAFIRKVLADGTLDPDALANKLSDKRYLEFSKAFGFGDYSVPRTHLSDFADKIIQRHRDLKFESSIGEMDDQLRRAMNADRELRMLAGKPVSDNTKWFHIMGSAPLRSVFQTAFGLPRSFASIDLDQQLSVLKNAAKRMLGSSEVAQFSAPNKTELLVRRYLLQTQIDGFGGGYDSAGATALALLKMSRIGTGNLSVRI